MKKLPIGIQTFSDIVQENYVYIDKTEIAYNLISKGKYYFLSRPGRFGKSLFVDTLHQIFNARKTLFKWLYIYPGYDWSKSYPVIKVSFADVIIQSKEVLDKRISDLLKDNKKALSPYLTMPYYPFLCLRTVNVRFSGKV